MKIKAELMERGKRIHVLAEDDKGNPVPLKLSGKIPGAYFRDASQRWSLPLGMATCRLLRAEFGQRLVIGPALWEWAASEVEAEKHQKALSAGLGPVELPRIAQGFTRLDSDLQSRPYQSRGARFIADGERVLIADDPGLGKTTTTIAGVIESGRPGPYLVAAPVAALNDAWEREIRTRLGDSARTVVISGSKRKREQLLEEALELPPEVAAKTWVIINIEMLRTKSFWECPECGDSWEATDRPRSDVVDCGHNPLRVKTKHVHQFPYLFDFRWGALIMDECQRSLLRNTGKQSQTRNGAMLLEGDFRVALSGTPMRGKPQRLWGTLNWLDRSRFSSRWAFIQRYWHVTATGYGGAMEIGGFRYDREEIFNTDLDRYMLRRSKFEVSPELPPKAYMGTPLESEIPTSPVAVWLPMDPAQEKAFREMASLGMADVSGGRLQAVGILAILTRLKQFSSAVGHIVVRDKHFKGKDRHGDAYDFWEAVENFEPQLPSNKYDWLEQWMIERNLIGDPDEEPTGKVVVVSQFTGLIQMFANQLFSKYGLKYARITGAVTGDKRQAEIDKFNDLDSGVNVMFLNTLAGGVAVTLDAADDMIFLDETHVPDDQKQAEGRIDNRRPEVKVAQRRYWYVKSLDSVDEAIAHTNARREAEQSYHLDGRRGVEYAREVFANLAEMQAKGGQR